MSPSSSLWAWRSAVSLRGRSETPTHPSDSSRTPPPVPHRCLCADRRQASCFPEDFPSSCVPVLALSVGLLLFPGIVQHKASAGLGHPELGGLPWGASALGSLRPCRENIFERNEGKDILMKKDGFVKVVFTELFVWRTHRSRGVTEPFVLGVAGGGVLAELSQAPLPLAGMDRNRGGNTAQGRVTGFKCCLTTGQGFFFTCLWLLKVTPKPSPACSCVCKAIIVNKSNYSPLHVLGKSFTLLNALLQLRTQLLWVSVLSKSYWCQLGNASLLQAI